MTRENLERAKYLLHDIEVLETIGDTQEHNHWTAFINADDESKILYIQSVTFLNDFKAFVKTEKAKLEAELEQI